MKPERKPKHPWYKKRGYVHFDAPISFAKAEVLVTNPMTVERRAFWPLISFVDKHRIWKKAENKWNVKSRPIAYASHTDSHIFSYYCWILSQIYEEMLNSKSLSEVVLAYRKHIIDPKQSDKGKTNFHFAAEVFAEIANRTSCEVTVVDIKSFFDTIPHRQLKENWCQLLETSELPSDHYAVYKAVTKFSCVPLSQVKKSLGIGRRKYVKLHSLSFSTEDFDSLIRKRGIINANSKSIGIPQGLPISGFLANLVMFEIDAAMNSAATALGGLYRRYSDDILIIAPIGESDSLINKFKKSLDELGLNIQDSKTLSVVFKQDDNGKLHANKPLQYLGLVFDGQKVLIRPQTLVKFGKRMARAVKRARNAAIKATAIGQPIKIRRRDLYARYSHLMTHRETPEHKIPKGSFMRYASNATTALDEQGAKSEYMSQVKRQLRGQWKRLRKLISEAERSTTGKRVTK